MRVAQAWWAVLGLATLHGFFVARHLWRDAVQPPFTELLGLSALRLAAREVVIMHHKRLPELNATLQQLASLGNSKELHVVVAQSLEPDEAAAAVATAQLIASLRSLPLNVSHRPNYFAPTADGSYSVNAQRFGTKRNSFRNLMHGLDVVFGAEPGLTGALVRFYNCV